MRAPYYLHKVLVQGLTLLYHIFLNGMEKVFKHCRILLIPSLCLSLPLCQAAYTCTINLFVMHQWCSPVRNRLHPREKLDPVSTWRSGASNMICKILDNSQDVISFQCNWREAVYNRHNHQCCSLLKMVVPLCGLYKKVTSKNNSFHCLLLVKCCY